MMQIARSVETRQAALYNDDNNFEARKKREGKRSIFCVDKTKKLDRFIKEKIDC